MKLIPRYTQQILAHSFFKIFWTKKMNFPGNYFFFNSGRSVIKWLLTNYAFVRKNKLKVGIPCYACYSIYQAVLESGNEAILLDIFPLKFKLSDSLIEHIKNLDVIIWIDYFGFKYNGILREINLRFPGLIIVEDCSHVDLRDYQKSIIKEHYSDYSLFSFNFRKPITAGGGSLLILNESKNAATNLYLISSFNMLLRENLSLKKKIYILIYNFSYNYLVFLVFNRLISRRRAKPFKIEQSPLICYKMNENLEKLFFIQFKNTSEKTKLDKYTFNYFNCDSELVGDYCFGSLFYFPLLFFANSYNPGDKNLDKFMLWENLVESYRAFNVEISEEHFSLTIQFLKSYIFYPAKYFRKPRNFDFNRIKL